MKLYETLYILSRFYDVIEGLTAIMMKHEYHKKSTWSKHEQIHFVTLFQNVLLDTSSYMDEYDNYLVSKSESEFKEKIITARKIAKPAADKIRAWSGCPGLTAVGV